MIFDLSRLLPAQKQYYLQHVVAPRPIALASTIDKDGNANLSPFSFFNLFSGNPPIVIFSPARRVRDNTTKHSLQNMYEVPEVVLHMVTYDMVQQVSLASCEYPKGVDEFIKAGFTKEEAFFVRPPMVKESKVKMECKVIEIKPLGKDGGAGNLLICEILYLHVDESLLTPENQWEDKELNLVARLGGDWYCRIGKENLFRLEKPNAKLGIGFDALPPFIRESPFLSGNNLAQLANLDYLPQLNGGCEDTVIKTILKTKQEEWERKFCYHAQQLLLEGKTKEAWQVLLRLNENLQSNNGV